MKDLVKASSALLAVIGLSSCAGLSTQGEKIRYVTKEEAPKDCKEIGDVTVGRIINLYSMKDVKNAMRNETAKMGGNFLVIDQTNYIPNPNGLGGYEGTGRAYQCPESQ